MVGALNKMPIAVTGLLLLEREPTVGGVVVILIGFVSGLVYALAKRMEIKSAENERLGIIAKDADRGENGNERLLLPLRRPSTRSERGRSDN